MTRLLALETSTEACSVALSIDGAVRERFELAPRRHAERVLPMIDELLAEAGIGKRQLDAVAVARGPGAFTGVRLALAVAQGIGVALGLPLLPISSLAALAQSAVDGLRSAAAPSPGAPREELRWLALADARMGEIYAGAFLLHEGLVVADGAEAVLPVAAIDVATDRPLALVGNGYAAHRDAFDARFAARAVVRLPDILPHAAALARLAERDWRAGVRIDPARVEPTYLRDKVALTKAERGV